MKNEAKTKDQLLNEIDKLNKQIFDLEKSKVLICRQSDEALRESEELNRLTLSNISDAIFITDNIGIFIYICPNVEVIFGYSFEEVQKMSNISKLLGEKLFVQSELENSGEIRNIHCDITDKAGKIHNLLVTVKKVSIKNGTRLYSCRDITERIKTEKELQKVYNELEKRIDERTAELAEINTNLNDKIAEHKLLQNALKESENKYRTLFENSGNGMMFIDEDMTISLVNKELEVIGGYSKEEVEGKKKWTEFIARMEDLERMLKYHMMRRDDPESAPRSYEFQLKSKSGKLKDVIATVSLIPGTNKTLAAIIDITQRKQFERQLKESEEKFREVFNNANDALYLSKVTEKGMKEHFIEVNDVAGHMLGYSREELLQMSPEDIDGSESVEINKKMEKIVKMGKYTFETVHVSKEGLLIPVEINARKFILNGDEALLAIVRDITERKLAEEKVRENEENFRAIAANAQDGIIIIKGGNTPDSIKIVYANPMAAKITGYSVDELINKSMIDLALPEELENLMEIFHARMNGYKAPSQYETSFISKDMEIIPTELTGAKTFWKGQKADLVIFRDIIQRKRTENALKTSEEKYRLLVETAAGGIVLLDRKGKILEANANVLEMAGLEREEVIGKNLIKILPKIKIDKKRALSDLKNILMGKSLNITEWAMINSKGDEIVFIPHYATIKDGKRITGMSVVIEDITERKKMENELKESLQEKEMLLKEIHHRVKNNLMVISSLLNLQSEYIKDKEALKYFEESQSRARSMAIIHEKSYQSADLKNIDFGDYIHVLTEELFKTYQLDPGLVNLDINVEDIELDINIAVPLGLIVNELVSNSMKHAFPSGKSGEIKIMFHKIDDHYVLSVSDNGVGFPKDLDFQMTESLGLQLVNNLVGQIDATIKLDRSHGTSFTIEFKEIKL